MRIFLLILLCPMLVYAVPVTSGLVSHFNFNSGISDLSGVGTTVSANNGATTGTGYNGSTGLVLDGVNDHVYVGNVNLNTNAGASNTVSFWMNWAGGNSQMPIGFSSYDLWLTSGYFGFNSAQSDVTGINSTGLANTWVYVTAVFYNGAPSPSTHQLYINGVLQTITQKQGSTPVSQPAVNYFYMGSWGATAGYYFQGALDEITVYNRALNSTEVSQLYTYYTTVPEPNTFFCATFVLAFFFCRLFKKNI